MMNVTLVSEYDFDDVVNNDIFMIIFSPIYIFISIIVPIPSINEYNKGYLLCVQHISIHCSLYSTSFIQIYSILYRPLQHIFISLPVNVIPSLSLHRKRITHSPTPPSTDVHFTAFISISFETPLASVMTSALRLSTPSFLTSKVPLSML